MIFTSYNFHRFHLFFSRKQTPNVTIKYNLPFNNIFLNTFTLANFIRLFGYTPSLNLKGIKLWPQPNKMSNLSTSYFIFKEPNNFFVYSCEYSSWMIRRVIRCIKVCFDIVRYIFLKIICMD